MNRRRLLTVGIGGAVVLLGIRLLEKPTHLLPPPGDSSLLADTTCEFLSPEDQSIIRAVANVLLTQHLQLDAAGAHALLSQVVLGFDRAVVGLPAAIQGEVQDLFGLLRFGLTRRLVAGVWSSWAEAKPSEVEAFLSHWRGSSFDLLRSAYYALHELTMAAWYGNPASWATLGYQGPPVFKP